MDIHIDQDDLRILANHLKDFYETDEDKLNQLVERKLTVIAGSKKSMEGIINLYQNLVNYLQDNHLVNNQDIITFDWKNELGLEGKTNICSSGSEKDLVLCLQDLLAKDGLCSYKQYVIINDWSYYAGNEEVIKMIELICQKAFNIFLVIIDYHPSRDEMFFLKAYLEVLCLFKVDEQTSMNLTDSKEAAIQTPNSCLIYEATYE